MKESLSDGVIDPRNLCLKISVNYLRFQQHVSGGRLREKWKDYSDGDITYGAKGKDTDASNVPFAFGWPENRNVCLVIPTVVC